MLSHPSFSSPLINEDLPAGPQLVTTLNNRFFRHQACYSLLAAKPGGQADRVISLCKVVARDIPSQEGERGRGRVTFRHWGRGRDGGGTKAESLRILLVRPDAFLRYRVYPFLHPNTDIILIVTCSTYFTHMVSG